MSGANESVAIGRAGERGDGGMIMVTITFRRRGDCVGGVVSMLAAVLGTMASTWILRLQQKV